MEKDELIKALQELRNSLMKLRKIVDAIDAENISRPDIKKMAGQASKVWFESLKHVLPSFGVAKEILGKYEVHFDRLLHASIDPATKTSTYAKTLTTILDQFDDDILLPVHKSAGQIADVSHLEKILENVANDDERKYLEQAVGCARYEFLGASVVLAWCGAIDRIQKKIEQIGFPKFNATVVMMNNTKTGRFAKFKKNLVVNSLNELRNDVPDSVLLWVVEGLGLIDKAEHDRLDDCYTKRCNAAHPGNAPITDDNLRSVFSDLKVIIFDNPKFAL